MDSNQQLGCLKAKWWELLEDRGHNIYRRVSHQNVIRSRNGSKRRYRWLLWVEDSPTWNLSKSEQVFICHHLKQAKTYGEIVYIVIGFTQEPKRIIAIPAGTALGAGYVSSGKGGIAWDD
ncbi:MAG: hypothetical protein ABR969_00750 [Sedimentisphaerales bacterium]|jgi:hypothetical protein